MGWRFVIFCWVSCNAVILDSSSMFISNSSGKRLGKFKLDKGTFVVTISTDCWNINELNGAMCFEDFGYFMTR